MCSRRASGIISWLIFFWELLLTPSSSSASSSNGSKIFLKEYRKALSYAIFGSRKKPCSRRASGIISWLIFFWELLLTPSSSSASSSNGSKIFLKEYTKALSYAVFGSRKKLCSSKPRYVRLHLCTKVDFFFEKQCKFKAWFSFENCCWPPPCLPPLQAMYWKYFWRSILKSSFFTMLFQNHWFC